MAAFNYNRETEKLIIISPNTMFDYLFLTWFFVCFSTVLLTDLSQYTRDISAALNYFGH